MPISNIGLQKADSISFKQNMSTDTIAKTKPYPDDSVEIQGKKKTKKKNSTLKKWAAGIGITAATFIGTILILMHRDKKKLLKLYDEKLVLSNLPEKLEFKEAKTLEDAIKFAKETLGIKEIDKGFTLDALNIANRGLVDVSNAHKGKLFIPKRLGFENTKKENTLAYVIRDINSDQFGDLVINKRFFDENVLNKEIEKDLFYKDGNKIFEINTATWDAKSYRKCGSVFPLPSKDLTKLIDKFYRNKAKLTLSERQTLFYSLDHMVDAAKANHRNPVMALKNLMESKSKILKANNITIDFAKVEKMTTKEQVKYLEEVVEKLESKHIYWDVYYGIESPASTIYHEMGHLQDFAKNLKELHIQQSFGESWEQTKNKIKNGEDIRNIGIQELDNRWGTIKHDYYKKLFDEKPETFKNSYPEFYEFLTSQEIQQTAGKVSWYSQVGIGEFIAETYKDMVAGKKIPEDVMALYRRYKGPEFV